MSDLKATVAETPTGFQVDGVERISYGFMFLDGVFDLKNSQLADMYKKWGRCLAIADTNVYALYGEQMHAYFEHYGIKLQIHRTRIGEESKTMETLLAICETMTEFGIIRTEPVLVVGGGLITDVAGYVMTLYTIIVQDVCC